MFRNIILFPHRLGQKRPGVDKTPYFVKSLLHPESRIYETSVSDDLHVNLYNLYQKNTLVNGPRINIGGDHSMSIATVADSLSRHSDLKVIWMDAHPDINTYKQSSSKNFHGMPLSILTGIENESKLKFISNTINPKNILYVGIRDIDSFEQKVIQEYDMNVITIEDIHTDINKSLDKLSNFIGSSPVHFSFDVDVLDPSIMPSTGTVVPNGIDLEPCKIIVDHMIHQNLVSVDLTELNLTIGHVEDRAKSLINFSYLFKNYIF